MRVGICTDSSSQLSAELAAQHEVEVVPMTITVGDVEFLDGVDIGVDQFYAMVSDDRLPATAIEPSPGQFAVAYDELVARGCTEILSIHAASSCGNLLAARVAARSVSVPVRLVDSAAEGFGVGCCAITAAQAVARGASIDEAAAAARRAATSVRSAVIRDVRPLVRGATRSVVPVLSMSSAPSTFGQASTVKAAVDVLAAFALDRPAGLVGRLRVAIGTADLETVELSDELERALLGRADVERFRIGPSVGAKLGPGAVICSVY